MYSCCNTGFFERDPDSGVVFFVSVMAHVKGGNKWCFLLVGWFCFCFVFGFGFGLDLGRTFFSFFFFSSASFLIPL